MESNDGSATVAAPGESVTESLKTNCEMCLILIVIIPLTHEFYS